MTAVRKQDSNFTELRYAVEVSPGVVDGSVSWLPLEPNSYKNFGAEVKTKARMPINASRQLKKAVVVDLDAMGGWQQDLTQTNFQDLSQSFFFAKLRTKSELAVPTVDGTGNKYQPASGGDGYLKGDLLFAKAFSDDKNSGLKQVSAFADATHVPVSDTGLVDGATQVGIISRVGFEFSAGEVTVDVGGSLPALVVTNAAAIGTLTTTGAFSDGDTITIGGKVWTLQSTLTNVDGHVHIAGSTALTLDNLKNAINGSGGTSGTDYAAANTASAFVSATDDATHLYLTALVAGAVGNSIPTTETCLNASFGAVTLTGGTGGRALNSFGLIPGEFVFVGDDASTKQFFHAANNGFARVRSVTATHLFFDKTQSTMVTDDGTVNGAGGAGQTIRIFFGRVIKNESDPTLIVRRYVQLERTLGAADDAQPTQIQAEYLVRSLADILKIDMKHADIIRLELDFLASTNDLHTGTDGLKAGTRPSLKDSDAFNSTSDVAFSKMAVVTAGNACPTPLFAYFTDLVIDLKNNIKQNKAVSVLGSFDQTAGYFQVQSTLTAYFTDVGEMNTVKTNKSITVETHLVKFNAGITIDLPLVVLAKALADVKLNEPIMIPLQTDAATAKIIDTGLDHTMLMVFWDFLPTLAG